MSTESPASVSVSGVHKAFGATRALRGVDLRVDPGEVVALVGHNGAGKSTLVKIVAGAQAADAGDVTIAGHGLRPRPAEALRLGVRCIYQSRTLMPNLSVAENVSMTHERSALRHGGREVALARRRLALLGCAIDVRRRVGGLSPGEAQEVEIARALDEGIRLLVLDEPTASLSAHEVVRLKAVMADLRRLDIGQLLVSHDLDYVLEMADRVVVLRDGAVVWSGRADALSRAGLVREMLGEEAVEPVVAGRARPPAGEPLLVAEELRTAVLAGVGFAVAGGEVLGATGVLGSGIDDLARVLTGAVSPRAGRVVVEGEPLRLGSPRAALRRGVVHVPADRAAEGLFENLRVGRQICMGSIGAGGTRLLRRRREARRARELAAAVALPADRLPLAPSALSGGNQQKVLVGRALDARPRVLVAHEPSVGVDVGARAAIHERLRAIAAGGAAVVVVSSDTEEIAHVSDRILVLRDGQVVLEMGPGDERRLVAAAMGES